MIIKYLDKTKYTYNFQMFFKISNKCPDFRRNTLTCVVELFFLGVKTPLQIAKVVCRSVCWSTILKCPTKSLKLAASSNIYHKVASDDNRCHHVSSDVIR